MLHDLEARKSLPSLDIVQTNYFNKIGIKPKTKHQMLTFCKQSNIPYKYKDINKWWPTRSEPLMNTDVDTKGICYPHCI